MNARDIVKLAGKIGEAVAAAAAILGAVFKRR